MAMSPIDIRMTTAIHDVAQMRQNELSNPAIQQHNITQMMEKQGEVNAQSVVRKENATNPNTKHDAKEKGKNEYFRRDEESKDEKENEGVVVKKSHGFDVTI